MNFLRLAEAAGWRTVFLGPAVSIEAFLQAVRCEEADGSTEPTEILVGVSYRLTPETGERVLAEFAEEADALRTAGVRFIFGGTPPMVERARAIGFFERCFDGDTSAEVLAYLKGQDGVARTEEDFPQTAMERIAWRAPFPIIRHHFGLPTVKATEDGIAHIAAAQVLDVISLGIDQDAQASFFHPERQNPRRRGAGGVPVRSSDDYRALYQASRRGNFPVLRTYSGTEGFIRLAEMYADTINIAWCAIPLFWFNRMDGRGPWDLEGSIREHQKVMAWYGERNIPVELNEPHHWGMRDASDVVFVVAAYLAAYNARAFGVRDYIAQMMFNSPPGLSDRMDLAKMLACMEMIAPLNGKAFRIWRQTRTGLLSYPLDADAARAHLAASVYLQMALRPHILHVVGHTEAHHAATADDVIEACKLARRSVENALRGQPDMTADPAVQARQEELVREAKVTLDGIRALWVEPTRLTCPASHLPRSCRAVPVVQVRAALGSSSQAQDKALSGPDTPDPLTDPATLARAVTTGVLDAPHLRNNLFGRGQVVTRIDRRGACVAVDPVTGRAHSEEDRIASLDIRTN